jgi:hypothetical protein
MQGSATLARDVDAGRPGGDDYCAIAAEMFNLWLRLIDSFIDVSFRRSMSATALRMTDCNQGVKLDPRDQNVGTRRPRNA